MKFMSAFIAGVCSLWAVLNLLMDSYAGCAIFSFLAGLNVYNYDRLEQLDKENTYDDPSEN